MRNWRQGGGDDWDERAPGSSTRGARRGWDRGGMPDDADEPRGRRRRGNAGYDEVDLGRALVPQNQGVVPMPPQDGGALAVPGFAGLDDEERAVGIRRPVYIPAVNDKPKVKPATWRVLSGVLSVLLVCVASCAAAGFLGRSFTDRFFPPVVKMLQTPGTIDYSAVPATPIATIGTGSKYVRHVVTCTGIDNNHNATGITSHFNVNQSVYLVFLTQGIPKGEQDTVTVRWYWNGNALGLPILPNKTQAALDSTNNTAVFTLVPSVPGVYTARIYWNAPNDVNTGANDSHLAAAITFGVYQPTPTPVPSTTATGTHTPGAAPTATKTK